MGERAPWFKLYGSYFDSPSHAELDGRALFVGIALMHLIRAGCDAREDRQTWALLENGSPCSLAGISRVSRWNTQITKRCLDQLVECGTVARREDGAYGMPKFWEHQESPWAAVKREQRANERANGGQSIGQSKRLSKGKSKTKSKVGPRQEERCSPSENEETPPEGGSPPSPVDPVVEAAGRVLARLNELRSEGVRGKGLGDTQWILRLLRSREDAEADAMLVLEDMAAEARAKRDWTHLNSATPFRLEHFEGRFARAQARTSPAAESRRPSLAMFDDYERATAEENSRAAR